MKLKMVLLTFASIAAYLALAVAGAGGWHNYSARPALLVLAGITLVLGVAALFTRGNLSSGEKEDRGNRWVFVVFTVVGLLLGYLPALTDRLGFLDFGGEGVRWLGVALFGLGGVLRLAPVFTLGERFSGLVAIQPGHRLVTEGLYRVVRNPSYLGLLISCFGWALAFRSGVGILLTLCLLPPLVARIHSEEALLGEWFGADYAAYRSRTWRLVPGLY